MIKSEAFFRLARLIGQRLQSVVIVGLCVINLTPQEGLAQRTCEEVLQVRLPTDELSLAMENLMKVAFGDSKDPRRNRVESKWVVKYDELRTQIELLYDFFGDSMGNRVSLPDGRVPSTRTNYLAKTHFVSMNGFRYPLKFRERTHGSVVAGDNDRLTFQPKPGHERISDLEIKFIDPETGETLKTDLRVYKEDVPYFSTSAFVQYRDRLRSRLLQLNKNEPELVDAYIRLFSAYYAITRRSNDRPFATSEYERVEQHFINLKSSKTGDVIQFQLTADSNVELTRLDDGNVYRPYPKPLVPFEGKAPLIVAQFTTENLNEFPGLSMIKNLYEWADSHQDPRYPKNKGKISKVPKLAPNTQTH